MDHPQKCYEMDKKGAYKGALIHSKYDILALTAMVYVTWRVRNDKLFNGVHPLVESIFSSIQTYVFKILFALYPANLLNL